MDRSEAELPRRELIAGVSGLVLTIALIWLAPKLARYQTPPGADLADRITARESNLLIGPIDLLLFLTLYLLLPSIDRSISKLKIQWRSSYTIVASVVTALAVTLFILHFGNQQFGGYDFSILIDTGWRLVSGQKPYIDFVCTVPPGFYLGLKYAFGIFGVNWDAQLYATAILAVAAFFWIFWLFSLLVESRLASFLLSLTIVCAAILTLDFWWYNNVTSVAATVSFLSCLAFLKRPLRATTQVSWVVSFALLCLMKPNVAGLLAAGSVLLALLATRHRTRFAVLTLTGFLLAIAFLAFNGISLKGMLASYAAAAAGRGALSTFGFRGYSELYLTRIAVCLIGMSLPFLPWLSRFATAVRDANLQKIAYLLLFVLAPLISLFAMFTNGELKEVEWPLFIAAASILLFEYFGHHWRLRRFYVAFLCALAVSTLYLGAVRIRVAGIGRHTFFEWNDATVSPGKPFFQNLTSSSQFRSVLGQIGQVLKDNPSPVFFGPRLEFAYAVFELSSPRRLPVWWHPGTSFRAADEPELLAAWRAHHFATLIFLKDDYTYYSLPFLRIIKGTYHQDNGFPGLTVFHADAQRIGNHRGQELSSR